MKELQRFKKFLNESISPAARKQVNEVYNDDIDIEMFVKIHDFLDKSGQDELRGDLAAWMRDNLNLDMLQSAGFTEL